MKKEEIEIKDSIIWVLNYIKGINRIDNINKDIELDLKNKFSWVSEKYNSNYEEFGVLYRGLYFTNRIDLENFLTKIDSNGFISLKYSSWTEDSIVAQNFMNGEGYNYYNKDIDDSDNEEIFAIKISSEIPQENILFSYLTFKDYLIKTKTDYQEELLSVNNESEFIIKEGLYKIEIDMATNECKDVFCEILGKNHCSIKYTEFI